MDHPFRYERGDRTMRDEDGNLVMDENDLRDCIPLPPTLCSLRTQNLGGSYTQLVKPLKENIVSKCTKEVKPKSPSKTYRKYTDEERDQFILLLDKGTDESISSLAARVGIKVRTAQEWARQYKVLGTLEVPAPKPRGRAAKPKLGEPHKNFLTSFVDENPSAVLGEMLDALSSNFAGLTVSKTTMYRFLTDECSFSFKLARKDPVERNSTQLIERRYDFAAKVKEMKIDYLKDCVFIDEAAFHYNLKRSQGWARKGKIPVVETPSTRAQSKTVLGAICFKGIVQLTLRKPFTLAERKKRKITGESAVDVAGGTTTGHFKQFLLNVMDELDQDAEFSGVYLVMDNASIHKNESIQRIVMSRGYKVLYLPPYSPELNPIEQFWHQLKSKVKRMELGKDTLDDRVAEAAERIPPENILNSIEHSLNCLDKCEAKEPL